MALALVNTDLQPRGERVDLLPNASVLARWLRERGSTGGRPVRVGDQDVERMRELRTAIRRAFIARVAGTRPPRDALATINAAAALVACAPWLRWSGGGLVAETRWAQGARLADVAFATIALNAVSVLVGERGDRLRLCEAHGCNRMFIADHRRRRWCSRTCGDRVRVARHYRNRDRSR